MTADRRAFLSTLVAGVAALAMAALPRPASAQQAYEDFVFAVAFFHCHCLMQIWVKMFANSFDSFNTKFF